MTTKSIKAWMTRHANEYRDNATGEINGKLRLSYNPITRTNQYNTGELTMSKHADECEIELCTDMEEEPDCEDGHKHDWEGVGGCDQNPGVVSRGGTTLVFTDDCKHCRIRRTCICYGSQRNPYQCDTEKYEYLEPELDDDG